MTNEAYVVVLLNVTSRVSALQSSMSISGSLQDKVTSSPIVDSSTEITFVNFCTFLPNLKPLNLNFNYQIIIFKNVNNDGKLKKMKGKLEQDSSHVC